MSQKKAPLRRFPLKTCFKRIFQDCSFDFQMCLWVEYLYLTCGQNYTEILRNYPKNIESLSDMDYWTDDSAATVLDGGADGVVDKCIHPGNDAPGVHAWVHARYHPKTVFRMIDGMLKLLYSICVSTSFGFTPLRHGLDRRRR